MRDKMLYHLKLLLSKISLTEILQKIEKFRQIDLRNITDNELGNEIFKTISVWHDCQYQILLYQKNSIYPIGTHFYRVRKLVDLDDINPPLRTLTYEQDAWNAPSEYIKRKGRLNKEGESLLYVSVDPQTAVEELKIENNKKFCLIVYKTIKNIKLTMIGIWEDQPELNQEENSKMRTIYNFLNDEFTRDVDIGNEFLYRTSEIIAKDYFDLPPRDCQDAWCYSSIAKKGYLNLCFRPNIAKEVLSLIGVQICSIQRTPSNTYDVRYYSIASGFDYDQKFKYYPINSDKCRQIFPYITPAIFES